uniref:hypothetical protein n=1 Tax=Microbacterium proteolyticum TaxID=1572644 RepID=UPI0024161B7A|nr:hypothetical protein [Microbacterium proteolyticum]
MPTNNRVPVNRTVDAIIVALRGFTELVRENPWIAENLGDDAGIRFMFPVKDRATVEKYADLFDAPSTELVEDAQSRLFAVGDLGVIEFVATARVAREYVVIPALGEAVAS